MKGLIKFMTSTSGKAARIVIGLLLIAWGVYFATNTPNWILIIIGLIPLLAGTFNLCILAPFFGYSLNGSEARRQIDAGKN